jgi:DNA polymerase-1
MARVWVFGDLSQAEARVVAWAGPVASLKQLFAAGEDVHSTVARNIARVVQEHKIKLPGHLFQTKLWSSYGQGDPERQIAKTTVHASNYGMGCDKFGRVTGLPEKHAKELQEIYFYLYPEIRTKYQAKITQQLKAQHESRKSDEKSERGLRNS